MSVQITYFKSNAFSSVIRQDDTVMVDLMSADFVELLEDISEKTEKCDENGNYWYRTIVADVDKLAIDELQYAEDSGDFGDFGDYAEDIKTYFKVMKNLGKIGNETRLITELYWKIS